MPSTGHVKWFSDRKSYGFITSPDCDADVFVHFSVIQIPGHKKLEVGQRVVFELETGDDGQPTAQCVVPVQG